jgi:hypothetical protein
MELKTPKKGRPKLKLGRPSIVDRGKIIKKKQDNLLINSCFGKYTKLYRKGRRQGEK